MKHIYLITYQLNSPGQNYNDLYEKIKQYDHCKCMNSVWLIYTNHSANDISNHLKNTLDSNDLIFISDLGSDQQGFIPKTVWDWIQQRQKQYVY